MKLLSKNKSVDREMPSFIIAVMIRFNQKLIRLACFLQQKTNGYSIRKKKLLLLLFLAVFIVKSTLVFIQSINTRNSTPINITRLKTIPIQSKEHQTPIITKEEFLKIQRFKGYMDSLSTTAKGRRLRDSLLQNRPHLMDSVNFLVTLHLEQLKNKAQ